MQIKDLDKAMRICLQVSSSRVCLRARCSMSSTDMACGSTQSRTAMLRTSSRRSAARYVSIVASMWCIEGVRCYFRCHSVPLGANNANFYRGQTCGQAPKSKKVHPCSSCSLSLFLHLFLSFLPVTYPIVLRACSVLTAHYCEYGPTRWLVLTNCMAPLLLPASGHPVVRAAARAPGTLTKQRPTRI